MALEGELLMYVCQSKDNKVTKKVACGGYAYTKRGGKGDVSYWYCDQRKICSASLIERNGTFTRKEVPEGGCRSKGESDNTSSSKLRRYGKAGWGAEGNHETHPPDLERVEKEIARRTRRLERKQRILEKRAAKGAKNAESENPRAPSPLPFDNNVVGSDWNTQDNPAGDNLRIDSVWGHQSSSGFSNNTSTVAIDSHPGKHAGGRSTENLVLIDTDGGCYDAWAMFLALSNAMGSGKNFKIVGITTVNGCTTVGNAAQNVRRVLNTAGKRIPVYKGMDSPLMGTAESTQRPTFFGSDGFGDPMDLPPLISDQKVESDHAVNAIIKFAERYKGKLTLLALGPLTNLAMAVKLKPEIKHYVKEVFVIGGNAEGVGNMTVSSEFNFYVDPEAAEITLRSFDVCPVYVLPWETCLKSAASSYAFRMDTLGTLGTTEIDLLNKAEATILSKYNVDDQWIAPDAVIAACFVNRSVMRKCEHFHCTVELQGTHTRGMMIVDKNFVNQKPANVTLITEVDSALYENMLFTAVGGRNLHAKFDSH